MKIRIVFAAAVIAFFLPSWTPHGVSLLSYRLDLDVYRIGGRVWLNGGHLYDALPATALGIRLPFTYPPFAAIVSSPLSLIPMGAAGLVVTLLTLTLLVVPLRIYLRRLAWPLGWGAARGSVP